MNIYEQQIGCYLAGIKKGRKCWDTTRVLLEKVGGDCLPEIGKG